MGLQTKGINVKARKHEGKDVIGLGFHKDTFIEFLNSQSSEWINIDLIPRSSPSEKGYTHLAVLREKNAKQTS